MDPFYASVREMRASMVSVEVIRRNFAEWDVSPYQYQKSNMDESENWCHPFWTANHANGFRKSFTETCKRYESFDFSIEPVVDGKVKHCSCSELDIITNFEDSLIQKTLTGRLFRGTIVEGSVSRPAIVKTWDYLLPMELENGPRLYKFCDEIELLTNERANKHPNLVKFYKCCFDRRLAVVYDAEFTRVLSDVLLDDDFGWDKRIKVAIQLADLLSWLHKNGIAVGSVTIECIMIDDEVNIKVFDFGYVSNHVNEDTTISALVRVGQEAPEIFSGMYADDEI
ncbi:probable LRR receptor-like serine/threonine-protein kinase At1g53420 isoform X3 [Capsicum annuum]|uniref:probable LRR receptor-like serine/threonine-protein kinase At1g53420 isoform X3 n=1 Tax=Capsicum annuum TaxID=4072 RepID=UPI0007BEED14|nr:probable LRR receptor-like serine/threonine-protein kinase At1g53420 isoform X3 [Capsicum annuum]